MPKQTPLPFPDAAPADANASAAESAPPPAGQPEPAAERDPGGASANPLIDNMPQASVPNDSDPTPTDPTAAAQARPPAAGESASAAAAGGSVSAAELPTEAVRASADPASVPAAAVHAPAPGDSSPEATAAVPGPEAPAAAPQAAAIDEHDPEQPELPMAAPPPAAAQARAAGPRPSAHRPWWARLLGQLMAPWVSLTIEPKSPKEHIAEEWHGRPVCYVLEDYGLSNALILERACLESGLPSPLQPLPGDPLGRKRAYVALSRRNAGALAPAGPPSAKTHSGSLARLLDAHRVDPNLDVQLVPVSIFVGRAPDRSSGWFSVLFSENWTLVGRFRRLLAIALNGRHTMVRFSPPVSLRGIVSEGQNEGLEPERTVRKLSRVLRTHFRRIRAAVIGPDLSTRRMLIDRVLAADPVKEAIADQARRDSSDSAEAWKKAHAMAYEIAADYSHPAVRSASFLLTPVWNRIYRGVLVHHLDKLKQDAPGFEVVYVPCHRSHLDYLLLSYLLYTKGIVPPHIAAGANLNLPVVGTILRKGGAFFLRRSIRGSALYSAVFSEYVAQLVAGGYSIEYFIEGGRSRTGRLLPPKGGMLVMTVRGFLRQPTRPVLFQPVYIGYEKLMEGTSYLDELSGKPKEKESIWQLLWGIPKVLRSNFGQVVVNFGESIKLNDLLAEHAPEWDGRPVDEDDKPQWLSDTVDALAEKIQINVNRAADVNPINLLALALLSTPKHAMGEADLLAQIALSKTLLAELPYSDRVTVTPHTPQEIVAHGEEINVLERIAHPLGDVLGVDGEDKAVLLSYFRNNVLHLFTAASWIACCFQHNRRMSLAGVLRLGRSVYPFLQAELFLPWNEDEFSQRLARTVDVFVREGLLERVSEDDGGILARNAGQTDEVFRLRAIGHSLQQAFERYYIAISVLVKNGPGTMSAGELESLCQLAAQRLSLLYAPAAPEFFDKTLFRGFIQKLRELKLVWPDSQGKLAFDQRLDTWAKDAKVILGRELRHTIEKISPEMAVKPAAPESAA
ncbi:glycerol-3-phosphate 1-O-acyltransferase PlsB [Lysobacter gummosus]|nr:MULTISPECIES: glycerol-3-phosphate 1-O-acyltransferase PlsB [Lysobacter]UJB19357.1 glycerol-3-phosphate 1-O-acyltransferase PlsB [Lysobacter capsici]UJQ26918.1 glycerol-3-phosphate 1-O-acyltransferase PlsB [Lysobacter gummosus]